jgi:peptidoglycan/LPS O-acetylase OafA/YrhL
MDREIKLPTDRASPSGGGRLAALVRDLAGGSTDLVRHEVRLVRVELGGALNAAARGSAGVAAGSVLLILGGLAVLAGIVFLIGEQWVVGQYWLAALIVFGLSGIVAASAAARGGRLLSAARLRPSQTLETLKEDAEWLTRRMQSDGTSK